MAKEYTNKANCTLGSSGNCGDGIINYPTGDVSYSNANSITLPPLQNINLYAPNTQKSKLIVTESCTLGSIIDGREINKYTTTSGNDFNNNDNVAKDAPPCQIILFPDKTLSFSPDAAIYGRDIGGKSITNNFERKMLVSIDLEGNLVLLPLVEEVQEEVSIIGVHNPGSNHF